jgi:DNA-binding CsgD family transcriptional regulator
MPGARGVDQCLQTAYAAAVEPTLWPQLLEQLADLIGGGGGALIQQNQRSGHGEAVVIRLDEAAQDVYFGFETRNVLLRVDDPDDFMRRWRPRVLTDDEWMAKDELVRSEYYDAFLRPRDMHSIAMIRLAANGMDTTHVSIGRSVRHGSYGFDDLELARRLHPHLIHAYNLGRKVADLRGVGQALAAALDRSPYGLFLLADDGRVLYANSRGEGMVGQLGSGLSVVGARLRAALAEANQHLDALVGSATQLDRSRRRGGSIAIPRPDGRHALSAIVSPIPAERFELFGSPALALVCVTDPESGAPYPEQRLRQLFGFTAAEARLAIALYEGLSLAEAAVRFDRSLNTVRAQLRSVLLKTQTTRQSELLRLMSNSIGLIVD